MCPCSWEAVESQDKAAELKEDKTGHSGMHGKCHNALCMNGKKNKEKISSMLYARSTQNPIQLPLIQPLLYITFPLIKKMFPAAQRHYSPQFKQVKLRTYWLSYFLILEMDNIRDDAKSWYISYKLENQYPVWSPLFFTIALTPTLL